MKSVSKASTAGKQSALLGRMSSVLCGIAVFLVSALNVQANIEGHWEGEVIGDGDQPIRVSLDIGKNAESEWIASMGLPDHNMSGLVVQDLTVESNSVNFVAVELMMTPFSLTLGSEGTLKGTISGPAAQQVEFKRTGEAKVELIPVSPSVSPQLEGSWEGTLQIPNGRGVPMAFHFKNKPDNTVVATFDSGNDKDLPLNDVKEIDQKVVFGMKIAHARFEGILNQEGTELTGKLIHGEGEGEHASLLTLRKK
jgi:hypothetical protein